MLNVLQGLWAEPGACAAGSAEAGRLQSRRAHHGRGGKYSSIHNTMCTISCHHIQYDTRQAQERNYHTIPCHIASYKPYIIRANHGRKKRLQYQLLKKASTFTVPNDLPNCILHCPKMGDPGRDGKTSSLNFNPPNVRAPKRQKANCWFWTEASTRPAPSSMSSLSRWVEAKYHSQEAWLPCLQLIAYVHRRWPSTCWTSRTMCTNTRRTRVRWRRCQKIKCGSVWFTGLQVLLLCFLKHISTNIANIIPCVSLWRDNDAWRWSWTRTTTCGWRCDTSILPSSARASHRGWRSTKDDNVIIILKK